MLKCLSIPVALLVFALTPLAAQEPTEQQTSQETATVTIPFTLTEFNNISIPATINGTDSVNLMFHTANGGVCLTKDAMQRITSVSMDQSATVNSWGGKTTGRFSENNSLQIGDLSWDEVSITEDEHSGRLTDGKFGPNMFGDKVVEIDFDQSVLKIHPSLPAIDEGYEKLDLVVQGSMMFVEGQMEIGDSTCRNKFLVHSGFGGTALLDDEFVSTNNVADELETISESELRDSFGNVLKTKKVSLPSLSIGGTKFSSVPVGIFDGAIRQQKMSVLGGDILKRFNIIIDAQNAAIYLKPNSLADAAFAE